MTLLLSFLRSLFIRRVQAIPDPYPELLNEPHSSGKLGALPVLGGVQHDYRLAAWKWIGN
jgi:hypothetical protein